VIEAGFERSRNPRTIVHRDAYTVASIDSDLYQRPTLGTSSPELDQVESNGIKLSGNNNFQRFVHVVSRHSHRIKKCGELPPHSARGQSPRSNYKVSGASVSVKLSALPA
jgi:hypothetical protein